MQKIKPKNILCCYVCGQFYGTQSLEIHLRFCIKRFINRQNMKLPQDRKLIPDPPEDLDRVLDGQGLCEIIEKFNSEAQGCFNDKVLTQCRYCLRTFTSEA